MLLGARQFFERRGAPTPPLPYDAEVEYLESTGTQYIDLAVNSTTNGFCDFDIRYRLTTDSEPPFGYKYGATARYGMWGITGNTCIGANNANSIQVAVDTNWHSVSLRNGAYIEVDGVKSIVGSASVRANIGVNLFAIVTSASGATSRMLSKACVSSFVLYDAQGNKILDFISVRKVGVGYMYDRVSGKLFRNQGTGSFSVGRDVNPISARSYVNDGLIAMWDGIENAGWGTHDANATVWKDLVGARDWTLGPSASYAWTTKSFDAKDQFAATQDFIGGSLVKTVEVCAIVKSQTQIPFGNFAFIIIGRQTISGGPYYGLLYRNTASNLERALMSGRSYWALTYTNFAGIKASFSFPNFETQGADGYFNGTVIVASGSNTLDYNATTRGTVARIGGTAQQPMPIEVYNIRLYSRALTAAEIAANYAIDKARFNLP